MCTVYTRLNQSEYVLAATVFACTSHCACTATAPNGLAVSLQQFTQDCCQSWDPHFSTVQSGAKASWHGSPAPVPL